MMARPRLDAPDTLADGEWKLRRAVFVWVPDAPVTEAATPAPAPALSVADRLRGYSQWRQGFRNDFTRQARREYQRHWQRAKRRKARAA